ADSGVPPRLSWPSHHDISLCPGCRRYAKTRGLVPSVGQKQGETSHRRACMTIRRRSVVLTGMAAFVPVLTGLALTSTPIASAHPPRPPRAGNASARTALRPDPPLGLPKPSGVKPFHGPP